MPANDVAEKGSLAGLQPSAPKQGFLLVAEPKHPAQRASKPPQPSAKKLAVAEGSSSSATTLCSMDTRTGCGDLSLSGPPRRGPSHGRVRPLPIVAPARFTQKLSKRLGALRKHLPASDALEPLRGLLRPPNGHSGTSAEATRDCSSRRS